VRFRKLVAETIAAERGDRAAPVATPQPARDERDARSIA